MGKTVMIIGLGGLGGWVLEQLARCQGISRIVAADKREDPGRCKLEAAAFGASEQGFKKRMEFFPVNLYDIDGTAELIHQVKPDVLYSAAVLQSFWLAQYLPAELAAKNLKAGGAVGLPFQVPLPYKLMQAVKKSNVDCIVLNNSFPDVINVMLWRNGFRPNFGAGNSDLLSERIRWIVCHKEDVPLEEVVVYLVTCHQIVMLGTSVDIPYYLRIVVSGLDVTSKYDLKELIGSHANRLKPQAMDPEMRMALINNPYIAASAVKNINAVVNDTRQLTHAPGPNGMPGGYPVRLGAQGAEVVLPDDLTLDQAVQLNSKALKWDGVEDITEDGTVIATEEARELIREVYGYEASPFKLEEADDRAEEMKACYQRLAKKYNVPFAQY